MRGGLRDKRTSTHTPKNYSTVENVDDTPSLIDSKARQWSKIVIISPVMSPRRNIAISFCVKKTRMVGYSTVKKIENMFFYKVTPFDTIHERDRQQDGRTCW